MASSDMPYRTLGHTGERVSAIGLGGWHIGLPHVDEKLALRLVHEALERGINFLDNSWDYHEGLSELRMGKALAGGHRHKAFLMTKIDGRTKKEALRQLEHSLARMGVDCIDLVQHHEVLRFEDPNRIFAEDGAQAALLEAQKAGKLRHIGFTGHKDPRIHLYMLEVAREHGFTFASAQMPINVMDAHFRSFSREVVPECVRQGVGVLAMKTMANGSILKSNTVSATECLRYALHLSTSVVIVGMDTPEYLEQACETARTFQPLSAEALDALLARTKQAALSGKYEPLKTSSVYDGTATHPDWLGEEPEELQALVPA